MPMYAKITAATPHVTRSADTGLYSVRVSVTVTRYDGSGTAIVKLYKDCPGTVLLDEASYVLSESVPTITFEFGGLQMPDSRKFTVQLFVEGDVRPSDEKCVLTSTVGPYTPCFISDISYTFNPDNTVNLSTTVINSTSDTFEYRLEVYDGCPGSLPYLSSGDFWIHSNDYYIEIINNLPIPMSGYYGIKLWNNTNKIYDATWCIQIGSPPTEGLPSAIVTMILPFIIGVTVGASSYYLYSKMKR